MNAYFIRVSEDKYSKLACKCQSREYYHQLKLTEPGILFSRFWGGTEKISRNEGRAGFALLNDLYLCGGDAGEN